LNLIEISWEDGEPPDWINVIESYCNNVLIYLGIDRWEISLRFIGEDEMAHLNNAYRDKDEPTDILSFCQLEDQLDNGYPDGVSEPAVNLNTFSYDLGPDDLLIPAGDLVIAYTVVQQNAQYFAVPVHEELARVLIHGILHLKGLDHSTNEPHEPMLLFQEKILSSLGPMERI
jgi:probable rRNA maturation factor